MQMGCRDTGTGGEDHQLLSPVPVLAEGQQRPAEGKGSDQDFQDHIPTLRSAVTVVVTRGKRPLLCRQSTGLLVKEEGFSGAC